MFIRIKYDRKCRKTSENVQTIEDLKKLIVHFFGPEAEKLHILYRDSENELVSIIDNDDLLTCYNEAEEMDQSNVTIILKSKLEGSRSSSSKKSSHESLTSSESEEDTKAQKSEESTQKNLALEAIEAEKAKVKAELEAKLVEVNAQAEAQKLILNKAKGEEISKSRERKHRDHPVGFGLTQMSDTETVRILSAKLKFLSRYAEQLKQPGAFTSVNELCQKLKQNCPGLMVTPRLFQEVFKRSKEQLSQVLIANYVDAVREDPSFAAEIERSSQKWEGYKQKHNGLSHHEGRKCHNTHHEAKHKFNPLGLFQKKSSATKEAATPEQLQQREAERAQRHAEKAQRQAQKQLRDAQREQERIAKETEKQARRQLKDREHIEREALREKVRTLRASFPKMCKDEIKNFVVQNPTTPLEEVRVMIQNYRIAKSTNK